LVLALLVVQLGLAACGGDNLLLPSDGEPSRISIARGDDQNGTVGGPLGDSLVVLVTDPKSRPVAGVEVVFLPPAGAAVAPNDTVLTGPNGEAAVHYTLSTTAGEQIVKARTPAIVPPGTSSAMFRVSAQPESAQELVAAGGEEQSGQVTTVLAESLAVRAVDRFGNGVAGIEVTWQASGGGEVSPSSVLTGADGRAATQRTLGDNPGPHTTTARAEGLDGSPVSFAATAIAPPRPELVLVTEPSLTAAAGVPLERQPEIQLQDPMGAPLHQANVSVTVQIASGVGSLGGRTTARSDANGRVSFTNLELQGQTGSKTLIFAAEGFTPVASPVITVRPGPPVAERSSVSVPNGVAGATTTIALHLEDEFGNPVSAVGSGLTISVDGANPASGLTVSDLGEGSYSASYVPVHSGTDMINVLVNGKVLEGSPFPSTVVPGPAAPTATTAELTTVWWFFYYRIDIVVTARDAQGNRVPQGGDQIEVMVDGGGAFPPENVVDNGDGTYSAAFLSSSPNHSVVITLNGGPIQGSPYTTP
jgi:hypothetical protein